jgi:hypothetical protein
MGFIGKPPKDQVKPSPPPPPPPVKHESLSDADIERAIAKGMEKALKSWW